MSEVHVVTKERHGMKRWRRYDTYLHAAQDAASPLVLTELARACIALPIGPMEIRDCVVPVALLGLEPGRNVFVDANGTWTAAYIPAAYRSYPFALGATAGAEPVLCVREDSNLLSAEGEPFFDAHGEFSRPVKQV